MLLVVLGLVASVIVTRGLGWMAVRFFGVSPSDVFSATTVTTPMSIVVLVSQAVLDLGAMLFLYVLLVTRTSAPFWPSIGWRETRSGMRSIRDLALQFLAGGALLALFVSFVGGFFNTKETLPIEELLKAPVSILLFGILGVVVAPFVEETLFRGFLYPVIARRWGIAVGIGITGTLFGLMHAAQLWGGWGQIALLVFVGVVLTWVRARTGTVAASFFVHLGYNGLQLAGYLVYTIGRGHH
jgi:membrane protease YdiL (CAAX protease family)